MKTSNKLLILITIVIMAFMVIYNNNLKAEYLKGEFKSRFFGMEQVPIKDFTGVDHQAANIIDASVEYGPNFTIWVRKDLKDKVKLFKQGKTLVIKYVGPVERYMYYSAGIVVTCPQLDNLTTAAYISKDQDVNNTNRFEDDIDVVGFDQKKMTLNAMPLTQIELKNNKLEIIDAIVGDNSNNIGGLNISPTNYIKSANIKVNGPSELKMINPNISTLEHSFSDQASLIFTGAALKLLK